MDIKKSLKYISAQQNIFLLSSDILIQETHSLSPSHTQTLSLTDLPGHVPGSTFLYILNPNPTPKLKPNYSQNFSLKSEENGEQQQAPTLSASLTRPSHLIG